MEKNIWITGPVELIKHGIDHIKKDDNFDFRIAMISIDNAVETTIKSFLNLNHRSLGIKYKILKDSFRRFPTMLDLLQKYCLDKISADELDAIEMFHMIRNNLYHQGTGITVNKDIVERYSVVATELISRLFEVEEGKDFKVESISEISDLYGEFLMTWREVEINLKNYALVKSLIPQTPRPLTFKNIIIVLFRNGLIDQELTNELDDLLRIRNKITHNKTNYVKEEMKDLIANLNKIKKKVLDLIQK